MPSTAGIHILFIVLHDTLFFHLAVPFFTPFFLVEYSLKYLVLIQNLLGKFSVLLLMKVCVSVRLYLWCHVYRLCEIFSLEIKCSYIIPETGLLKYSIYPDISVILDNRHDICGNSHLDSMKLWLFKHLVKCM